MEKVYLKRPLYDSLGKYHEKGWAEIPADDVPEDAISDPKDVPDTPALQPVPDTLKMFGGMQTANEAKLASMQAGVDQKISNELANLTEETITKNDETPEPEGDANTRNKAADEKKAVVPEKKSELFDKKK